MPIGIESSAAGPGAPRRGGMFRALSHRNYRVFWVGAFFSNAGTWMQTVAQGWLVLQLTDSAFWLGVDGFMATAPGLLLTLVGGVFADLVDRKRLLILTQVAAGLSALVLAALMVTGVLNDSRDVWMILVLSFATGCCMAIAGPSYQAITVDLVEREDLANAIALNSAQFQLSRVVGPLLAGLAIQAIGLAGCFFVNGLSFAAIVFALWQVRLPKKAEGEAVAVHSLSDRRALWQDLLEGFRYVGGRPRVRFVLICSAVTSLFGAPYLVLIPVFARDVYGWGETGLSVMMGVAGAGSFMGALLLTMLGDFRRKGLFALGSSFLAGICLIGFSLIASPSVSLLLLCGVGFAMVSFFALSNTLLQKLVTDQMRGRVMSIWILTFIGAMPIGSIIAGWGAARYGAPRTMACGGLIIAVFVIIFGLRKRSLWELS